MDGGELASPDLFRLRRSVKTAPKSFRAGFSGSLSQCLPKENRSLPLHPWFSLREVKNNGSLFYMQKKIRLFYFEERKPHVILNVEKNEVILFCTWKEERSFYFVCRKE